MIIPSILLGLFGFIVLLVGGLVGIIGVVLLVFYKRGINGRQDNSPPTNEPG